MSVWLTAKDLSERTKFANVEVRKAEKMETTAHAPVCFSATFFIATFHKFGRTSLGGEGGRKKTLGRRQRGQRVGAVLYDHARRTLQPTGAETRCQSRLTDRSSHARLALVNGARQVRLGKLGQPESNVRSGPFSF